MLHRTRKSIGLGLKDKMVESQQTNLGKVLKRWREGEGLNQREAADEIGISASTLCRLETGESAPDANTFMAMLKWLFELK